MVKSLGGHLSRAAQRWLPDPFVIAILLTLTTVVLAWVGTSMTLSDVVGVWGGEIRDGKVARPGIWKFLAFGMMMCFILVTGHALASAPAVRRGLQRLASIPRTASGAVMLTSLVAMAAALVNWGLGLIVGALLARDMALSAKKRGVRVHFPLLAAAGYSGMLVWHGGLSGSAPLTMTTEATARKVIGPEIPFEPIPLTETIFSPLNLAVTLAVLLLVPVILMRMQPAEEEREEIEAPETPILKSQEGEGAAGFAGWVNQSRLVGWSLAALGGVYLFHYVTEVGVARVDLNTVNLLFLTLGLVAHGRPQAYAQAIGEAARGCSGIILQFPIYAGIMAVLVQSGLVAAIAGGISSVAQDTTYGMLTFLSAGGVNVFVPSGGGQFGVQGPIVLQTAASLGIEPGKAIMAFAYGDQWTNMLQPFWALPLLAITGLPARKIIGYTATLMILVMPVYLIALSLF